MDHLGQPSNNYVAAGQSRTTASMQELNQWAHQRTTYGSAGKKCGPVALKSVWSRRGMLAVAGSGLLVGNGMADAAPSTVGPRMSTVTPFINTVVFGGSAQDKLAAVAAAGFHGVELWDRDVTAELGGAAGARAILADLGLGAADYQVLLDFDGAPPARRAAKRQEAQHLLDTMAAIGIGLLVVSASYAEDTVGDQEQIAEDMHWVASQAATRNIRIAYEPLSWSRWIHVLPAAWEIVRQVDLPNLGLVVDSFHVLVRDRPLSDVADLPIEKVFLVQLSDCDLARSDRHLSADGYKNLARSDRLFPGEGHLPIAELVQILRGRGYAGPLGIEVFNTKYHAEDPRKVAERARDSLRQFSI